MSRARILLLTLLLAVPLNTYGAEFEKSEQWALEQGIVTDAGALDQPCTKGMLAVFLWAAEKMPEAEYAHPFTDAAGYILQAEQWAASSNIIGPEGDRTFGTEQACTREMVATAVWLASGAPDYYTESTISDVPADSYSCRAVRWAVEKGVMDGFTERMFAPHSTCTARLAADAVYRAILDTATREWFPTPEEYWENGSFSAQYDGTASHASQITREQFVSAVANAWRTAHENGYRYGSSGTLPPTDDGIISCDRLIAKALWDLGFTDQTRGGITLGNMIPYLQSHGFVQGASFSDIGYGSIVIVKGNGKSRWSHTFVTLNFDPSSMTGFKFDCGSDSRIQSFQPQYEGWGYQTDILVFNLPSP